MFGYNRSVEGVAGRHGSTDSTPPRTSTRRCARAADSDALIVLAVPMPALPLMLGHIRDIAPDCPLTDVTSVKGAVLARGRATSACWTGSSAGIRWPAPRTPAGPPATPRLFVGAPWVISVDDHVDPDVWTEVMHLALDCGAVVVPARSDEHDAAAATISHLPHLLAEALAVTAGEVPLAFALAAGSFRDGTRVAATAPDLVRAMCEANSDAAAARARPALRPARPTPATQLAAHRLGGRTRRGRPRRPDPLRQLQPARDRHHRHRRGGLARRTRRRRARGRGDQIRSASPG